MSRIDKGLGRSVLSEKKSQPAWGFAKASRFRDSQVASKQTLPGTAIGVKMYRLP
jgi:hypothetical protein